MNRRMHANLTGKNYRQLKAALLLRGHTLRSWAIAHGYNPNTVYNAARGIRHGKKSAPIARELASFTA